MSEQASDQPTELTPWFLDTIQGNQAYWSAFKRAATVLGYVTVHRLAAQPGGTFQTTRIDKGVLQPPLHGVAETTLDDDNVAFRVVIQEPGPDPDSPYDTNQLYDLVEQFMDELSPARPEIEN